MSLASSTNLIIDGNPNPIRFKVDSSIGKIGSRWILAPRVLQNFSYRRIWPPPQTQLWKVVLTQSHSTELDRAGTGNESERVELMELLNWV